MTSTTSKIVGGIIGGGILVGGLYVFGKRWYKDYKLESAYMEMHAYAFPECTGKCPVNGSHSINAQIKELQKTPNGIKLLEQYRNIGIRTTVKKSGTSLLDTGMQTINTQLKMNNYLASSPAPTPISAPASNLKVNTGIQLEKMVPANNENNEFFDIEITKIKNPHQRGQSYKSRVFRKKNAKSRTAKSRTAKRHIKK